MSVAVAAPINGVLRDYQTKLGTSGGDVTMAAAGTVQPISASRPASDVEDP